MRYYRAATGVVMTTGKLNGTEIEESEYIAEVKAAEERCAQKDIIIERTRPLTSEEVTAMLIRQQINGLTVDDNTALRMMEFYPEWVSDTDYSEISVIEQSAKDYTDSVAGETGSHVTGTIDDDGIVIIMFDERLFTI